MYDCTSLLTTIASISASIVAILGGFIASKLISIYSDRNTCLQELETIKNEINTYKRIIEENQTKKDEEDVLDFFSNHINDLLRQNDFEHIDFDDKPFPIEKLKLKKYWEIGISITQEISAIYFEEESNGDNIPFSVARKYKENEFKYSIAKNICQNIKFHLEKEKNPFAINYNNISPISATLNYREYEKQIIDCSNQLMVLESNKKMLNQQLISLKKPKGVLGGLIIFALFSIFCILLPLSFTPCYVAEEHDFMLIKWHAISFLITGLISIFSYLCYLLKWDELNEVKKNDSK